MLCFGTQNQLGGDGTRGLPPFHTHHTTPKVGTPPRGKMLIVAALSFFTTPTSRAAHFGPLTRELRGKGDWNRDRQ